MFQQATTTAPTLSGVVVERANNPSFDLTRVIARVARENPTWDGARLQDAEEGYRAFLSQAKIFPKLPNKPTADVDCVWHAHILFTKQYHEDCVSYFGFYYHHEPESGGMCNGNCGGDCHGGP